LHKNKTILQITPMLILSLDTSTRSCSVAVHQNGLLLACYALFTDKSSSGMLTTLIQNTVEHAGFQLTDLDVVAVAKGPGSYTGLRIATSTVKGLCFALDKPLVAINTLEAMAAQLSGSLPAADYLLCPMIDARRMEVFCAVFDQKINAIQTTQALIIDDNAFAELLAKHKIVFFGDGADKCKTALDANPNAIFIETQIYPSAKTVGELALKAIDSQQFEDLETFEPYYLKDFVGTTPRTKNTTS
jgi:tRNA threonylcarbamoyladenosine biosynthesis protein TsaB